MKDRREQILERLTAIADSIDAITTAARNVMEFSETKMPAVGVLEGDEEVAVEDVSRGRPSLRPYVVTMTPQLFLRAQNETVGSTLNEMRLALIKRVLEDQELNALSLNGRGVRYAGLQSTLHAARSMVGATALVFAITYMLVPDEL